MSVRADRADRTAAAIPARKARRYGQRRETAARSPSYRLPARRAPTSPALGDDEQVDAVVAAEDRRQARRIVEIGHMGGRQGRNDLALIRSRPAQQHHAWRVDRHPRRAAWRGEARCHKAQTVRRGAGARWPAPRGWTVSAAAGPARPDRSGMSSRSSQPHAMARATACVSSDRHRASVAPPAARCAPIATAVAADCSPRISTTRMTSPAAASATSSAPMVRQ